MSKLPPTSWTVSVCVTHATASPVAPSLKGLAAPDFPFPRPSQTPSTPIQFREPQPVSLMPIFRAANAPWNVQTAGILCSMPLIHRSDRQPSQHVSKRSNPAKWSKDVARRSLLDDSFDPQTLLNCTPDSKSRSVLFVKSEHAFSLYLHCTSTSLQAQTRFQTSGLTSDQMRRQDGMINVRTVQVSINPTCMHPNVEER